MTDARDPISGRPVSDSPNWDGPLYAIDLPNPEKPGHDRLFHLDTTEAGHKRMIQRLQNNGVTQLKTRIGSSHE